jgi:DNA-binding response OmpR family regulator
VTAGLDRGNGLSLLIADDDPSICRMLQRILTRHMAHGVNVVDDGQKALNSVALHAYAGLFLDHEMPGLDGLELARLLRAEPGTRGLPIMIISATTDPATVKSFLDLGIHEYLLKPISPVQATSRIDAFVRRCEAYDFARSGRSRPPR